MSTMDELDDIDDDIADDSQDSLPTRDVPTRHDKYFTLGILTLINLFNFVDRYIPSSTKDLFKDDLELNDTQTSLPLTAFMVVYMFSSPLFGMLADRGFSRKLLISSGILLWSIASSAAFISFDFWSFLFLRALVGVGEAAYITITPALIRDLFGESETNRALSIFYSAIPVGAAIGFSLGGVIGSHMGWRYAFLITGIPGILLSLLALKITDPRHFNLPTFSWRGNESISNSHLSWTQTIQFLISNRTYVLALVGQILATFVIGGMADWISTYIHRVNNVPLSIAGTVAGIATVIGGIGGTLLGAYFADYFRSRGVKNSYFASSSITTAITTLFTIIVLFLVNQIVLIAILLTILQVFLWSSSSPINTLIVNSVPDGIRTRAFSFSVLMCHLLGDAISPTIIGAISDSTGSLRIAVSILPVFLFASAIAWGIGWHTVRNEFMIRLNDEDEDEFDNLNEISLSSEQTN